MGRGCLTLLAFLVPIGLGAVLPPALAVALYAFAILALLVQSLGQQRFGPRFGLPGLLSLPLAAAIGAALAIGKSLAAAHGWLLAVLLAALAGLLLLLPLAWIGRRFEPRDPLPPLPEAASPSVRPRGLQNAPDDWRPLGDTGLKVLTVAAGERGMGGPPHTFIHTLSVALCLSGEEWGLSDDGRWWVVGGREEEAVHVVDLPARVLFRGPWRLGLVPRLLSGPSSAARLAQLGFERVRAYVCRSDGLWWPQGEPVPPTEAVFGPAAAGLRRVALIDAERMLEVGDALLYAQQPDWRIESEAGPLPLILSHGALDDVLWREGGMAALFPASQTSEGGIPPAAWYLWSARGDGRWIDFGRTWERGILGLGAARPTALREDGVEIACPVYPFPGVFFPARASAAALDEHFTPGPLPWFPTVDEHGWPVFEEVGATVPLSALRTLQDPADTAGTQPLSARHPAGTCLVFEPMGPPVDPREQRPYRLRHERVVLEGISPVPRWMDGAGRFVVLQGVLGRALASHSTWSISPWGGYPPCAGRWPSCACGPCTKDRSNGPSCAGSSRPGPCRGPGGRWKARLSTTTGTAARPLQAGFLCYAAGVPGWTPGQGSCAFCRPGSRSAPRSRPCSPAMSSAARRRRRPCCSSAPATAGRMPGRVSRNRACWAACSRPKGTPSAGWRRE